MLLYHILVYREGGKRGGVGGGGGDAITIDDKKRVN